MGGNSSPGGGWRFIMYKLRSLGWRFIIGICPPVWRFIIDPHGVASIGGDSSRERWIGVAIHHQCVVRRLRMKPSSWMRWRFIMPTTTWSRLGWQFIMGQALGWQFIIWRRWVAIHHGRLVGPSGGDSSRESHPNAPVAIYRDQMAHPVGWRFIIPSPQRDLLRSNMLFRDGWRGEAKDFADILTVFHVGLNSGFGI